MNSALGFTRRTRAVEPEAGIVGSSRRHIHLTRTPFDQLIEGNGPFGRRPVYHNGVFEEPEICSYRLYDIEQGGIDKQYSRAAVVQEIQIILGPHQRIEADRHRPHFDGPEKCLRKDFGIEKQQRYTVLHP